MSCSFHDNRIQLELTQKMKLKKNNRYLTRTIPPDAILTSFSARAETKSTQASCEMQMTSQAGTTLCVQCILIFVQTHFRMIRHFPVA